MSAKVDVAAWWARIRHSEKVWKREKVLWDRLERAVDGDYGGVTPNALSLLEAMQRGEFARLEVNVLGQIWRHYLTIAWDRYPTFRFRDLNTDDQAAVAALEGLVRRLAEEGRLQRAGRAAMGSSLTRGPFVLWPIVERSAVGVQELIGSSMPPAAFVELALRGEWDGRLPLGVDAGGVLAALSSAMSEPRLLNAMGDEVLASLSSMETLARRRVERDRRGPHPAARRTKITWVPLPVGDWFLPDLTVTDYENCGWVSRKVVLTPEEFRADPTFTDAAKAAVRPIPTPAADGGVPSDVSTDSAYDRAVEEEGRVVLREVWDRVGWRRFFLADTYDGVVSKDTTPLYMREDGLPLFPDFFPCSYRTPIDRSSLTATRVFGRPLCEDMWGPQIEYIEFLTAAMRAAKNTIRVSVAGQDVDDETLNEWRNAQDSTCIRMSKNAPKDADPSKQFAQLPMPPAPVDLLRCADIALSSICSMGRVNRATITGDPIANTATQEQISVQGAGVAQGDMIRVWEDGTAEAAFKGLLIFLYSASPQEFESYLGADALLPRPSTEPPVVDPATGEVRAAPPMPSIVDVIRSLDLTGAQLECRFDASTRSELALRIRQVQDAVALANTVRDGTGAPYADVGWLLQRMFAEMDVPWKPWRPTPREAAALQAPPAAGPGVQPGGEPEDRSDSRRANGERGTPAVPGRQTRGRKPDNGGSMNGHQIRRATALS